MFAYASGAGAATQIGETFSPTVPCGSTATFLQTVSPGDQYVVPADGVITSWSFQANETPPALKFKVGRSQGGTMFTIVGESDLETPAPKALNTYPVQIRVQAGDLIGFFDAVDGTCGTLAAGYVARFAAGDVPPGTSANFPALSPVPRLDVSATLEADCDNDGLGDETQDGVVDCVAPETTITSGPPPKTRKRSAKFEFSSSEPGSTFQCQVGASTFVNCGTPFGLLKVKKGGHTFAVRAKDPAGNVDQTPAAQSWIVKKKKRRKRN
jgi:hypothetical protein